MVAGSPSHHGGLDVNRNRVSYRFSLPAKARPTKTAHKTAPRRGIFPVAELQVGLLVDQPLTPPAVRPLTIRRWARSTTMINGTVMTAPAAMICV